MSKMSKFVRELLIGLALVVLGIWLSVSSKQFLFYGLIIAGVVGIIIAFMHLSQSKNKKEGKNAKDEAGPTVKKVYPTDRPQEKAIFLQGIESQDDLDTPKQVSVTCSRRDQAGPVFLNGVQVGTVEPDTPVVFSVTKKNNVVNISEHYEGICFFHVVNAEGTGSLKVGMGIQAAALKVVRDTGLAEGIVLSPDKTQ